LTAAARAAVKKDAETAEGGQLKPPPGMDMFAEMAWKKQMRAEGARPAVHARPHTASGCVATLSRPFA
jgi:hypothetical protein